MCLALLLGLLEITVAITSIIIYIFLFFLLSKTQLLHAAFRTTARIFSVAVIIYMLLSIILVVLCEFNPIFSRVHLSIQKDSSFINVIYEMHQSASFSFWLGLSFITVERAIASYHVRSYEQKFDSQRNQIIIISIFVVLDVLENLGRVFFPKPTTLTVCFSNTFVNMAVMYFIKRTNTNRNSLGRDLSYRYQVRENVLVSSALLPLTYINFIFAFALLPFMFLMIKESDQDTRKVYAGCFYLISAWYPLTYALGLLRSAAFRKVMISQGIVEEKLELISNHEQYETLRSRQDELWKVAK